MNTSSLFLNISIVVGLITPIIGIYSVLNGSYKPQRITRAIFFIITALFVSTLFAQGDRVGLYLACIQLLGSTIIFLLSFVYGVGGKSTLDIVTLISAMGIIVAWQITGNATLALYLSLAADFCGFIPTIIKSWQDPSSENWKFYGCDVIAGFFNVLALQSYLLKDMVFPAYILLINALMVGILWYRKNI